MKIYHSEVYVNFIQLNYEYPKKTTIFTLYITNVHEPLNMNMK